MHYTTGNLLEANAQALVNTVNTVGVMGKGIALQFKQAYPLNFRMYAAACKKGELYPGKLLVVKEQTLAGEKIIINFPTKTEWRLKSRYEYVELGLKELVKVIEENRIQSIAIPPLGCGNGGLDWERVKSLMEQYLGALSHVDIQVFEPSEAVREILKQQCANKEIQLTPVRAMMLYALFAYESLGENASLFVANKLAYFLQRLGEKSLSKLAFAPHHYGPYSVQVEHLLHHLNGKYLKGMEQMNAKPFEPLELQYDKQKEVMDYVEQELSPEQCTRLSNLVQLMDGFQSALSLEILATVDYIMKENPGIGLDEITQTIHHWSVRKQKLFQDRYVQIAVDHLKAYGQRL
jgi:O-acetyl-ADP-ribose deacetylase (regulator of RNase III)